MGKGDKKTRKGKITQGSYGKTRPKKSSKSVIPAKVEKPKKEVAPKAEKPKKTEKSTGEVVEEKPKTTRKKKTEESIFGFLCFFQNLYNYLPPRIPPKRSPKPPLCFWFPPPSTLPSKSPSPPPDC